MTVLAGEEAVFTDAGWSRLFSARLVDRVRLRLVIMVDRGGGGIAES